MNCIRKESEERLESLILKQTTMQKERARLQAALGVANRLYNDYKLVTEIMLESKQTEVMKEAAPNWRIKSIDLRETIEVIISDTDLFEYYQDIEEAFDYIRSELENLEKMFEKVANQ